MKKIILFLVTLILSLSVQVFASNTTYLDDGADLLTDTEEAMLFERIQEIQDEYDLDVTLLTMNEVPGGGDLLNYLHWYTELDPDRNGVVFGINMDPNDRGYATSTRNESEYAFNSNAFAQIDDGVRDNLVDGEYYEALDLFLDYTIEFTKAYDEGSSYQEPIDVTEVLLWVIAVPLVLAIIVAFAVMHFVFVLPMKTAVIKNEAQDFVVPNSLNLRVSKDKFLRVDVRRIYDPVKKSSSGGGGSSGFGGSRGGSSGRF